MDNKQYIIAIEVGSSKITGALAEKTSNGLITFEALEEERMTDIVRYGCIKNVDETSNRIHRIIKKLEARSVLGGRKIKSVFVGVGGHSVKIIKKTVERDYSEDTTINEELLRMMEKQARSEVLEGYEILDVVPEQIEVDKILIKNPVGMIGKKITIKYNLVIGREQLRANLKRVLVDHLQLKVEGYDVTALSIARQVLTEDERQLGSMLVDFGAETTTVSIYKDNYLAYLFTMPMGSRNITRDITSLKIVEDVAETIKKTAGNAIKPDSKDNLNIEGVNYLEAENYIIARSNEIVANIVAHIEYAGMSMSEIPGGIVVVGGGANLNGFIELLHNQTNIAVRKGIPSEGVNLIEKKANNLEYVSIVSLVASAAEFIKPGYSCCTELPAIERDVFSQEVKPEEQKEQIKEPETPKAPKKPKVSKPNPFKKFLNKVQEKTIDIFSDSDDDDDDDDDEK